VAKPYNYNQEEIFSQTN